MPSGKITRFDSTKMSGKYVKLGFLWFFLFRLGHEKFMRHRCTDLIFPKAGQRNVSDRLIKSLKI